MLEMDNYIDVIIPRGGKSLIERVLKDSKVHVIRHLDEHVTYIHKTSDPDLCKEVTVNAKMRRLEFVEPLKLYLLIMKF